MDEGNFERISSRTDESVYDIYLVGFPHPEPHKSGSNALSREIYPADWVRLAPHLAPEANIFNFVLSKDNTRFIEEQSPVISYGLEIDDGAAPDVSSDDAKHPKEPDIVRTSHPTQGFQYEARLLLEKAKEQDPMDDQSRWRPIIFVGYQLGGLIVKQAMVLSNTEPRYHDIALRTHKLVLVATPQHEGSLAIWENILDDMILSSDIEIRGRKSAVLAKLAISVNEMAAYFQGALNYPIVNLPDHIQPSSQRCSTQNSSLPSYPLVGDSSSADKGQITEFTLRGILFPKTLATEYMWDIDKLDAALFYSDLLNFLQLLSPSNQLIHRSTVWQMVDEDSVMEVYAHHVANRQPLDKRYIQVIGPPSHGKATLVKAIAQKIMLSTKDSILLDLLLEPFELSNTDFQALLRSFIHQILSQRPALFSQIRPLYVEHHKSLVVGREDTLWTFLHILLQASPGCKIVVAAANIHLGSSTIQSSLEKFEELFRSLESDYSLILSSTSKIPDVRWKETSVVLDLASDDIHQSPYIQWIVKKVLFSQPALHKSIPPELVSIAHAERYAELLSRRILLSTSESAETALRDCPRTESAILDYCIHSFDSRLLHWRNMVFSWVHKAVRPLRTKELAMAITFSEEPLDLAKLTPRISKSLEADLKKHLSLVLRVNGNLAYFHGADTRKHLDEKEKEQNTENAKDLRLITHGQIVRFLLQYIIAVVSRYSESECDAHVAWFGELKERHEQAELELLDYAVHCWPEHYRAHIQSDSESKPASIPQQESTNSPPEPLIEDKVYAQVLEFLSDDFTRNRWYRLFLTKKVPTNEISGHVHALEAATELGFPLVVGKLLSGKIEELPEPAQPAISAPPSLEKLLQIAVRHGHSELVKMFVGKGAAKDDPFLEAASRGRVDYMEMLWADNGLIQSHCEHLLEKSLHLAIRGGNLTSVEFFDRTKVSWDWKDEDGSSILHAAAFGGRVEILEHFKERKPDLDLKNNAGRSPLMVATRLNHTLFVEALCNLGADATLADDDGKTPLHYAIVRNPNIVNILLQHGASPVKSDQQNQTPLHHACSLGDISIVEKLVSKLKESDSVNIRNNDNETPLHIAAACGNRSLVSFLLSKGADASLESSDGKKPINIAATKGHLDVFKELYSRAKIYSETQEALVRQSVQMGQLLIVRFLLEKGKYTEGTDFHVGGDFLAVAASKGYTEVVRLLIQYDANPNFLDEDNLTPLFHAVKRGSTDVAVVLLDAGADPNPLNEERSTPLHHAASRGMTEMVGSLLAKGANVNGRTIVKYTPLHLSVAYPGVVKRLLEYDPDLAPVNYAGLTPLHLAVTGNHIETIELLINKDSELIHIPGEDGITPLHGSIDLLGNAVFELLCSKGGLEFSQECYQKKPPIIHALTYPVNLDVVRFLLTEKPATAASRNPYDVSTLHLVAKIDDVEILDKLFKISDDLDVNGRTTDGDTPLHYATGISTVQMLIGRGANVNAVDEKGRTALYKAAWEGKNDIVECLLNAKADPSIRNRDSLTALHAGADSKIVLETLLSGGAEIDCVEGQSGWTALMRATYWERPECISVLLGRKADVSIADKEGRTALHLAEQEGPPILSQLLLEAEADVTTVTHSGQTPLHYAARYNEGEWGRFKLEDLLNHGAAVNVRDAEGNTPLHHASMMESSDSRPIEALIEAHVHAGLSIDDKNNEQRTPLHNALVSGTSDRAELLIKKGASLNAKDAKGNSCLVLAASAPGSAKKVKLLLNTEGSSHEWSLDNKVASFLSALKVDLDTASIIAKHDTMIFQHENDTFTVLQCCLDGDDYDRAREFLQLGANPFRYKLGQPSAFQQASVTRKLNSFSAACLEKLAENHPDQCGLFQGLRLRLEGFFQGTLESEYSWSAKFTERTISDQDGWTIDDFILQSDKTTSYDTISTVPSNRDTLKTATRFIVPEHWALKKVIQNEAELSDGNKTEYMRIPGLDTRTGFRSDHPFPPRRSGANCYFEVEILRGESTAGYPVTIGIGLCGEFVDMSYGFPGWSTHRDSVGYHSDDGLMYDSFLDDIGSIPTGKTYKEGDTAGCGIDWDRYSVYYTLNGECVGRIQTSMIFRKSYPAITAHGEPGHEYMVKVNFGKGDFRYSS